MSTDPRLIPVIAAIGEVVDRPADLADAVEPVALMEQALRAAEVDAGSPIVGKIETLDLVGLISWGYRDPVALLCERLDIQPARATNASMGGDTPVRLIHEAAVRIARGEQQVAAIVGGEASNASTKARRDGVKLAWTPRVSRSEAVRFSASSYPLSSPARSLAVSDPAQIYPFYEVAFQHAQGKSPRDANRENAELWARYAAVAADNPCAWLKRAPDADVIGAVNADNRFINWPYPKLMVANPSVNQAAAIVIMSLAAAREAGIAESSLIHIWGGAAASEPEDYLLRANYAESTAQAAVLEAACQLVGGGDCFDHLELYSCFPVVPKMALRSLGSAAVEKPPTVTGGLTFFGGPFNNYMSHATAAMVRKLRSQSTDIGLLYGQGGYVTKHHALVLSARPSDGSIAQDYSVQMIADARRGPVPPLLDSYNGPAAIETYSVRFARDGSPQDGIVIARTPAGERTMAKIPPDEEVSLALLLSQQANAIGSEGIIRTDVFGKSIWRSVTAPARQPSRRYARVEREGHLTIITINRPDAMNALNPQANGELAEIFDDFAADPDQWVAIITGAGEKAFSSGNDLKYTAKLFAKGGRLEVPLTGFGGLTGRFDLEKPVIAAVNGIAMGGGFEIALASDLIVASATATFALPEPKVGLAALEGGFHRLPREIGLKRAMSMILTGRVVSADEGMELGFVNQVVAPEELMAAARRLADTIIECSPMSIRASKQAVMRGLDEPSVAAAYHNQSGYPALRSLFRSADFKEGPQAFAEKRRPRWTGN